MFEMPRVKLCEKMECLIRPNHNLCYCINLCKGAVNSEMFEIAAGLMFDMLPLFN